jgi:hypothetical protein
VNGSFESSGSEELLGLASFDVATVELWSNGELRGIMAANGNVFIELDHRGNPTAVDGIYQDVPTISGRSYELRFSMRSRSAISTSNNEAVIVNGGDSR